ncbi:hypothetical protein GCM10011344_26940 [Dokdonia pacifica]|uniref:Uncharacterized protein n=1 Tax=Dokdonia pacifica TaxID=1627892 RepID=A0A239DZ54_9FLAO|nr:hypothetical protein [Dokdonia pacifica]GGG24905.1 hypothetical protein GCM10011344_26940 [Dokdonia pacifica]SNS37411.1 hypothetical protein SAMN06265376_1133 [Dokdonia pacifica]
METPSIVDTLIQNISTDQELLKDADAKITQAKEEKATVADRLKGYRKEVEVFLKYANEEQKKQIEAFGFDTVQTKSGLNDVATHALNIIMEAKGNFLTNDELYTIYAGSHPNPKEVVNYTAFNIKCRPLFNSQKLLRKKAADGLSSREDIISLNGTPIKKGAPKTIALKKGILNEDKKDDTTVKEK